MSDRFPLDIDRLFRVQPGKKANLDKREADDSSMFPDRDETTKQMAEDAEAIGLLQDRLYAENRRAVLIVLQGTDTSGKDGTIRHVMGALGPLGVTVTAFKQPSELELAHDFLWRVHIACPHRGMVGIFNRSHYEDVLVGRVRKLAPAEEIEQRYDQINAFEKLLAETGTTILKFMLHISKDEQRERLQDRLDDPKKRWKFQPGDLEDRKMWADYQDAYEIMLTRCSTDWAPWYVIPADRKWARNAAIAHILRTTLEDMDPKPATPSWDPKQFKVT